jgi:hypothetical protein
MWELGRNRPNEKVVTNSIVERKHMTRPGLDMDAPKPTRDLLVSLEHVTWEADSDARLP